MNVMRIGQVARRANIPASAIRYYERVEVLPEPERRNGQRVYGPAILQLLEAIQIAQELGFSLDEIKLLLGSFQREEEPSRKCREMARPAMCHTCPPLSRRRFLLLAGAVALLAACGRPGALGGKPAATFTPLPDNPTFAGEIAAVAGGSLTLQAPLGRRTLPLADAPQIRDPLGDVTRQTMLPPGTAVAAWLEEGAVTALQQLPPMASTYDIPGTPRQPPPTGETRALGPLSLITRAGWGAAPAQPGRGNEGLFDAETDPAGYLVYPEPLATWLTTLVAHHSALAFGHGPRAIQRLHVANNGFADVGYHFFVDGLGQLYEGRPLSVRGAHTGGHNTGTVGVCLLGNFEVVQPAAAQLETLQALARTLRASHTLTYLAGHRDFQPDVTVCPGAHFYPLLPPLAAAAGLAYGTAGYVPPPW